MAIAVPSGFSSRLLRRMGLIFGTLVLVAGIVLVGASTFFTYRVASLRNDTEDVTPASFLLTNYETVSFNVPEDGDHYGWLLRGLRGAPVIMLCHGYDSNRSELLSLGTVLQENHFNVYLFNFQGPKTKQKFSDMGVQDARDLKAAIDMITRQNGVNPKRVGLYGVNLGGYASLAVAQQDPRVKAVVVDSVYGSPDQMFDILFDDLLGGGTSGVVRNLGEFEFHMFTVGRKAPPVRDNLAKLGGTPKLFLATRDAPVLAKLTENFYMESPQPKKMLVLEHSRAVASSGGEKKEYDFQVLSFFLQNLPLHAD